MCGIVAGVSGRNVVPVLIEGLKRLEYRGYDSCGIAVFDRGLKRERSVSRIAQLETNVKEKALSAQTGIAHTRWATHGAPSVDNAHPHFAGDTIALIHNGIIENYEDIRNRLRKKGYAFVSQTDTEALAWLIYDCYEGDILKAVQKALLEVEGAYAIACFDKDEPHRIVVARKGSPLLLGIGENEIFAASDSMALAGVTRKFVYLEEDDIADLTPEGFTLWHREGKTYERIEREVREIDVQDNAVALGPYAHYMQKEIFEQPQVIGDTMEGVSSAAPALFGNDAEKIFSSVSRVQIVACGTSFYAGLVAKYWLEDIAGIPTDVEIASEYRYRRSVVDPEALFVTISQSGETADTRAALSYAKARGMTKTLTICNVSTSALVRESRLAYITRAGIEIGVASTKAFTTQLASLFVLTLTFAKLRGRIDAAKEKSYITQLRHLGSAVSEVLRLEPDICRWAKIFADKEHALFLGRGIHYPIAMEGALKLKEISYIHAEAYAAGELKHGPLALVDAKMPVVTVAPNDELLEKLKSNMREVEAREGALFVFADKKTGIRDSARIHVIRMPENYGELSPILYVVALQLLAYHTAVAKGNDVDKPRNLAKSVTVE